MATFLDLPYDVRCQIYKHFFSHAIIKPSFARRNPRHVSAAATNMMLVPRAINADALPFLTRRAIFDLSTVSRGSSIQRVRPPKTSFLRDIRFVHISCVYSFCSALREFSLYKSLKVLHITLPSIKAWEKIHARVKNFCSAFHEIIQLEVLRCLLAHNKSLEYLDPRNRSRILWLRSPYLFTEMQKLKNHGCELILRGDGKWFCQPSFPKVEYDYHVFERRVLGPQEIPWLQQI